MPFVYPHDVLVILRDYNGMAYSNDWLPVDLIFGCSPTSPDFPVGTGIFPGQPAQNVVALGTGPGLPGLIYPEIYLPAQRQLLIDVQQDAAGTAGDDLFLNFIGAKVFKGATG